MKSKKILIAILILIATILIGTVRVEAATAEIYASKATVEVGESVTITAKFVAAAWNIKVSGNGIDGESYASQTSDLSETENVKTCNFNKFGHCLCKIILFFKKTNIILLTRYIKNNIINTINV